MKECQLRDAHLLGGGAEPGFGDREMPVDILKRLAPSNDTFCYQLVHTWRNRVWSMLSDVITEDVKSEFLHRPPDILEAGNLSWLDELIGDDSEEKGIEALASRRLRAEFRTFRGYHATRTDELSSFYNNGLRTLRSDLIETRARSIFLNDQFPHVTEERLEAAIHEIGARNRGGDRDGWLHLCAIDDDLIGRSNSAGHYLIYGSEYLYDIGVRIVGNYITQNALSKIGRPTIFVCDVPMPMIDDIFLNDYVRSMLCHIFVELFDKREIDRPSQGSGSGLALDGDLPAKYIVGHFHPTKIFDPFLRTWYDWRM